MNILDGNGVEDDNVSDSGSLKRKRIDEDDSVFEKKALPKFKLKLGGSGEV